MKVISTLLRSSRILLGSNFSNLGSNFKVTTGIFRKESIGMAIPITNNCGTEQLSLLLEPQSIFIILFEVLANLLGAWRIRILRLRE
nr:hypothetical protein CFP56_17110 [Quercus suber]